MAICNNTHRFIEQGECPWCHLNIRHGQITDEQGTELAELRWNTTALVHAVTNGEFEDAIDALANMMHYAGSVELALPILRSGLFRREADVSAFAERILSQFGDRLKGDQVEEYQGQLKDGAADDGFALRVLLLGAFFRGWHSYAQWRQWRSEHILWLISNHPRAYILSSPESYLSACDDNDAFVAAKQKWLDLVASNPNDLSILDNAASFFRRSDRSYSESLYRRAELLEPDNPKWSVELGQLSSLMNVHKSGTDRVAQSQKTLLEYQNALAKTSDEVHRLYILPNIAKAALGAQDLQSAESAVAELAILVEKPKYIHLSEFGHDSFLLRGRCALAAGDISSAKALILKASEYAIHGGSGPNLRLAKELLEHGERSVVVQYLRQCSKSWQSSSDQISEWIAAIEIGRMPDFGANLEY